MNEILSIADYEEIEKEMARLNSLIVKYDEGCKTVINSLDADPIMKEFYESGNYGIDIKERLEEVRLILNQFHEAIGTGENSLYVQTKKYVSNQIDLLSRSSRGYTRTDSIRARREGNRL